VVTSIETANASRRNANRSEGPDMTAASTRDSSRSLAILAGVLYLLPLTPFAEFFVRGRLIVPGNPAATASHIVANEFLWRMGGMADLIAAACDVGLALIFFTLLARVSLPVSLLAAFFRVANGVIYGMITTFHFGVLAYLSTRSPIKSVAPEVLQGEAFAALRLHAIGLNIGLFFFGFSCIALGYLLWRSRFLPRLIAGWVGLAGIGYLVNAVVHFLAPTFGAAAFNYVAVPCGIGELLLAIWLLFFGINEERWKQHAAASAVF